MRAPGLRQPTVRNASTLSSQQILRLESRKPFVMPSGQQTTKYVTAIVSTMTDGTAITDGGGGNRAIRPTEELAPVRSASASCCVLSPLSRPDQHSPSQILPSSSLKAVDLG